MSARTIDDSSSTAGIDVMLAAARGGDHDAASAVFGLLYEDLRRLARSRLRPHRNMTLLDTTSLVHESYIRLVKSDSVPAENRKHFFAYAASVMRSVIVDHARARLAECRGGGEEHLVLDTAGFESLAPPETDVLRVHEALDVLAGADERMARMVEMRYFGGLSENEIAEVLGVSARTIRRDWEKARLLLHAALQ